MVRMADRLAVAEINISNYTHNLREIRKLVGDSVKIMAIIKANAYGHGLVEIAKAALKTEAEYLGIVSLGELKELRENGIHSPILILNYIDTDSIYEALSLDATLTVFDEEIIQHVSKTALELGISAGVHMDVDTGMHRAGCAPEDARMLAELVRNLPNISLEGVFTHFAESEDETSDFTSEQLAVFNTVLDELAANGLRPNIVHAANSAAVIAHPDAHFDMVRPGIITYGLTPFNSTHSKFNFTAESFKPVLSLKSVVAHIRNIQPGEGVGYNRRWKAERPSKLALVPIGYGDGWRRTPNPAKNVIINGHVCEIVGSVSMDQIVVDVTDVSDADVGDEVVLIGSTNGASITADDIAAELGTINYEVVTQLNARVARKYT